MKQLVEFKLDDGEIIFVEAEDPGETYGIQRVSAGQDGVEKAEKRFTEALARVRPAAEAVLKSFQKINTPDEIGLEFGLKFNAKAGVIFASADSESTFRGLTRAFMCAGTPAVSVTLWSVESESAKILSTGLYKNLKTGMIRAEALREIKLWMIRGEEPVPEDKRQLYQHPFFWAPMVIFWDGCRQTAIPLNLMKTYEHGIPNK